MSSVPVVPRSDLLPESCRAGRNVDVHGSFARVRVFWNRGETISMRCACKASIVAARKADLKELCRVTGWQAGLHHTGEGAQSALLWLYRALDRGAR